MTDEQQPQEENMRYQLHQGDCLEVLRTLPDASVDAVVTDPPYGLSFMSKKWDYDVPSVEIWEECLRVLKPGGHILAFAGTRTQHRMAVRIEDAGFEIRDMIAWVYGSSMPKHRTQLKPALEPITVARKTFRGSVSALMESTGLGGMRVEGCRVGDGPNSRWPANFAHDGSDEVLALFPETTVGGGVRRPNGSGRKNTYAGGWGPDEKYEMPASTGSAARYFYCAKASKKDRGEGNNHPTVKPVSLMKYLCRLVTPPGGTVLDPFMGSGSTGKAAMLEGFRFIGIEREAEYVEIAKARIEEAAQ